MTDTTEELVARLRSDPLIDRCKESADALEALTAELAEARAALEKTVAAANAREEYNQIPPDRNRIGDKKSRKSRHRDIWMRALRRAEASARVALKGDDT